MITILQQSNCLGEFRLLMNESSINYFNHKQIRHVLTVWVTFCEDLTLMLQTVFEQPINPFNDTFASTNSPWNHFFVSNQSDLREREKKKKKGINKLMSLRSWQMSLLAKQNIFMENEARKVLSNSRKYYWESIYYY